MKKMALFMVFIFVLCITAVCIAQDKAAKKEAAEQVKAEETLEITLKFGTGVEERVLQGEAESFAGSTEKVYCWTHIKGAKEGSEFKHIWYLADKKVVEVVLPVKSANYRTWSSKTISGQAGEWKVEIVDSEGKVVKEGKFTIEAKAGEKTETKTDTK